MTAQKLFDYLLQLQNEGNDLSEISINFRENYDSDVVELRHIEEDLFDEETNNILTSISLMNRIDDVDDETEDNF